MGGPPARREAERFERMLLEHEAWLSGKRPNSPFRTIAEVAELYDLAFAEINERSIVELG